MSLNMNSAAQPTFRWSRRGYRALFAQLSGELFQAGTCFPYLPAEIVKHIHSFIDPHGQRGTPRWGAIGQYWNAYCDPRRNPSIARAGACPILKLPNELLYKILVLSDFLPPKDVPILPLCDHAEGDPGISTGGKRKRTSEMMTVCKKFKEIIGNMIYEERTFVVHVQ